MKSKNREDYRKHAISIALTEEEFATVTKKAKEMGVSKAGYIRMKALYGGKKKEE